MTRGFAGFRGAAAGTFYTPAYLFAIHAMIALSTVAATAQVVTTNGLLREMIDRESLARLPEPWYICTQSSSYDRASRSPDHHESWFANADAGHFLRVETRDGRTEHVLLDESGPGAVVRIWSANPSGTLRLYLDDADAPAIEVAMDDFLSGKAKIGDAVIAPPLAAVKARGWNVFLPIAYAKRCIITSDRGGFYYHVNVRRYADDAQVETFSPESLDAALVAEVNRVLSNEPAVPDCAPLIEGAIASGESRESTLSGGGAIRGLRLIVDRTDLAEASLATLLQTLVIELGFDGDEGGVTTVWAPAGDFFGSGVGASTFRDWQRSVATDDQGRVVMTALWVMPYRQSARIALRNLGEVGARVRLEAAVGPWTWDERSMHFHSTWRREHPLPTRPMQDWNYVEIKGRGVYVGDTLAVANPVPEWWGEGDEKVYIDGETFPSHFGTGTEDYYGYAWCSNEPFSAPFHAQPRSDGLVHGNNWGHSTVARVRALDAMPFESSLRMDMEVWHWKECEVGYAATTYFYARPGATHNREASPDEVERGVIDPPPLPPPFVIPGAIECETMQILAKTEGRGADRQGMAGFARDTWSGDAQLWFRGQGPGEFVELRFPVPEPGRWRITLHATRSWDYGIAQFTIDGRAAGEPIDMYSGRHGLCLPTGPIDLGVYTVAGDSLTLRATIMGGHPEAHGTRSFLGLDCVVLTRP